MGVFIMKHNSATNLKGLTTKEAASLREKSGWNALPEKNRSEVLILLAYFWGPIPWMIEAAATLSAVLRHWPDLIIILAMLIINACVGFWQEHKAQNVIALLKAKLSLVARALRDGKWQDIPARELVPGDMVMLRLGNIVPADLKLTSGDFLTIDQSALTGESLPVSKKIGDPAYSGSIIKMGEMNGIVTSIGTETYFGKTAKLAEGAGAVSHFQQAVMRIGNFLILLTLALISIIILVSLYRHNPILEMLQFCLILTVAAIPVALPAVLSVTMAVGAVKLAKMQAIVSRLVALEELAGMDVLCCDKTGTLTQNKISVGDPWLAPDVDEDTLLLEAALASNKDSSDSIDHAVVSAVKKTHLAGYKTLHFLPFDPVKKYSRADLEKDGKKFSVVKGAPQVILDMCANQKVTKHVDEKVNEFAAKGFRTLGVARSDNGKTWTFQGLIPLFDPPRKDAASMLKSAQEMGVKIKMMTGDHVSIAKQIAAKLNLGQNILVASALFGKGKNKASLNLIEKADGVAEVFPEHKYAIIKSLQGKGHIVGMTGDGVNDAPPLKQADVGIAVSGATDAARAAADIVLTEQGISVIVLAIEEARRIFHRMTSYATFRIAETIRVLFFMTLSILVFDFYPVTAIMIVLLAILNDFPIMMIAFDNATVTGTPLRWDMHKVLAVAMTLGTIGVVSTFLLFWYVKSVMNLSETEIHTLMFLKLLVAGHLTLFITRSYGWFWQRPWPRWILVVTVETTQVAGTLAAVYGVFMTPIGWTYALAVWAYALGWFVINDAVKVTLVKIMNLWSAYPKRHLELKEAHFAKSTNTKESHHDKKR
jgi:H+-transporting ATPase